MGFGYLEGGWELDTPIAEGVPVAVPHMVDLRVSPNQSVILDKTVSATGFRVVYRHSC